MISIHPKQTEQFEMPNSTHWIQCASDPNFRPVFEDDPRVTIIKLEDEDASL